MKISKKIVINVTSEILTEKNIFCFMFHCKAFYFIINLCLLRRLLNSYFIIFLKRYNLSVFGKAYSFIFKTMIIYFIGCTMCGGLFFHEINRIKIIKNGVSMIKIYYMK